MSIAVFQKAHIPWFVLIKASLFCVYLSVCKGTLSCCLTILHEFVCARMPWLMAQRPGLFSGGFELTWIVACSHQTWCMLVWCGEEITPDREVDRSTDTNLSIWLTRLYYKSWGGVEVLLATCSVLECGFLSLKLDGENFDETLTKSCLQKHKHRGQYDYKEVQSFMGM